MNIYFTARCPYCGHENKFSMEIEDQHKSNLKVYTCDVEEGGCDQPFVVGLELKPAVTIRAIEGFDYVEWPEGSIEIDEAEVPHGSLPGE